MKPIEVFDSSMTRAKRLVSYYESFMNNRRRRIRSDWAESFRKLMHWPKTEPLDRVDNEGKKVIVILRDSSPVKLEDFDAEPLKDLLRAALVAAVAAVDRYLHDIIVFHFVRILMKSDKGQSPEMRKVGLSVLDVKHIISKAKRRTGRGGARRPRPMNLLKRVVQDKLHAEYTFQSPVEIERGLQIMGVTGIWSSCSRKIDPPLSADRIKEQLNSIVRRRNLIVHEGDHLRKIRRAAPTLREIDLIETRNQLEWLSSLTKAIDATVSDQV